ncbi:MAG: hypothetical protein GX922_02680 [Firmicutes bacterium]|jgi:hypothetical protein|nr:hypothetical protein [Bacillota bacterium]
MKENNISEQENIQETEQGGLSEVSKNKEFTRGFIFGLGFWAAGTLVMFVPFAAVLFAIYTVLTKMLF